MYVYWYTYIHLYTAICIKYIHGPTNISCDRCYLFPFSRDNIYHFDLDHREWPGETATVRMSYTCARRRTARRCTPRVYTVFLLVLFFIIIYFYFTLENTPTKAYDHCVRLPLPRRGENNRTRDNKILRRFGNPKSEHQRK